MGVDVVIAQAAQQSSGGDIPWWVSLIVVPILGVLIEALRRALKVEKPTEAPPEKPPPTVGQTLLIPPPSATADEKMVYVEQLIGEITRSRDEARRELAEAEATIARLRERQTEQDAYVARLQAMLDMFLPPGRPPGMGPAAGTTRTPQPPRGS